MQLHHLDKYKKNVKKKIIITVICTIISSYQTWDQTIILTFYLDSPHIHKMEFSTHNISIMQPREGDTSIAKTHQLQLVDKNCTENLKTDPCYPVGPLMLPHLLRAHLACISPLCSPRRIKVINVADTSYQASRPVPGRSVSISY